MLVERVHYACSSIGVLVGEWLGSFGEVIALVMGFFAPSKL